MFLLAASAFALTQVSAPADMDVEELSSKQSTSILQFSLLIPPFFILEYWNGELI